MLAPITPPPITIASYVRAISPSLDQTSHRHPERHELASGVEGPRPVVSQTEIPRLRSYVAPLGMIPIRHGPAVSAPDCRSISVPPASLTISDSTYRPGSSRRIV